MNSIKFSLLLAVISIQSQAFEINEYFAEFRLGTQDQYEKKVERRSASDLSGDFKGTNYGLRFGAKFMGMHEVYLEHNPQQDVEIKSANELAHVSSTFLGYRYLLPKNFYVGASLGYSSFELVKGPNGIRFDENPETSGLTYGGSAGYRHNFLNSYYLGIEYAHYIGSYKEDGPTTTPVKTIEIEGQQQLNLTVGYKF